MLYQELKLKKIMKEKKKFEIDKLNEKKEKTIAEFIFEESLHKEFLRKERNNKRIRKWKEKNIKK